MMLSVRSCFKGDIFRLFTNKLKYLSPIIKHKYIIQMCYVCFNNYIEYICISEHNISQHIKTLFTGKQGKNKHYFNRISFVYVDYAVLQMQLAKYMCF